MIDHVKWLVLAFGCFYPRVRTRVRKGLAQTVGRFPEFNPGVLQKTSAGKIDPKETVILKPAARVRYRADNLRLETDPKES